MTNAKTIRIRVDMELVDGLRCEIQEQSDEIMAKQREINEVKEKVVTTQFQSCFWKFEEAL
jgi:hypothetical protein